MGRIIFQIVIPVVGVYLFLSGILWGLRAVEKDCAHRYMDYVFPITKLHCEIKDEK